jgi:parvulin-like peptidyl-prolyl isomerase
MTQYRAEVSRYEAGLASLNRSPASEPGDYHRQVLDTLIDQVLIEQAAASQNITVTDQELDDQVQGSIQDAGGQVTFTTWLQKNQWSSEDYRQVLRSEILTQKMIAAVTASVPITAEHIHARHILVASETEARNLLAQLNSGADFADLARQQSLDANTRDQGGDLGWFPRGVLTAPEVEQAAFTLQPGQLSEPIKSSFGYHIIQVVERDPNHRLSDESLERLQQQAFERWLAEQRAKAQIERLVTGS